MKRQLLVILACLVTLQWSTSIGTAAPASAKEDLQGLVEKVRAKLQQNKNTEADLADELKEFDAVLARHKGGNADELAEVVFMQAMLYLQVLDNDDKGAELIKKLKADYAETKRGKEADRVLESIAAGAEAKKIQRSLAVGSAFPDFDEKDLEGKALSIARFRGKLVLIDFWATWCGPCVQELPNVLKTYEKYHPKGFEIIGISLDEDETKLRDFIKSKQMPWPQYFDGKGWENKLSKRYGVQSIPATYLLDAEGKILARGLRGASLEETVAKHIPKAP